MVIWVKSILIVVGALVALGGLFGPAFKPAGSEQAMSLFALAGGLSGLLDIGAAKLPEALTALKWQIIGPAGLLVVAALATIVLAALRRLRSSLIGSVLLLATVGFLFYRLWSVPDAIIEVPQSWAWIPLLAGSLVSVITGVFSLIGTNRAEEQSGTHRDLKPAKPAKPPKQTTPLEPKPAVKSPPDLVASIPPRAETPETPGAKAGTLSAMSEEEAKMGAEDPPRHGDAKPLGSEEPTESSGWVLSGFDADGMAIRLNISDMELRNSDGGIVIGRSSARSRLVLKDDSVSRAHARLALGEKLIIEDLGSSNGTLVEGRMIGQGEQVPIEQGASIEVGAVRLTLTRA